MASVAANLDGQELSALKFVRKDISATTACNRANARTIISSVIQQRVVSAGTVSLVKIVMNPML